MKTEGLSRAAAALFLIAAAPTSLLAQSGYVRTLGGDPIAGAKVSWTAQGREAYTDSLGFYDLASAPVSILPGDGRLAGRGREAKGSAGPGAEKRGAEKRGAEKRGAAKPGAEEQGPGLRDIAGRLLPEARAAGRPPEYRIGYPAGYPADGAGRGGAVSARKGGAVSVGKDAAPKTAETVDGIPAEALLPKQAAAPPDTLEASAAGFDGGLGRLHRRPVPPAGGRQDFRLVSTDPAWKVCEPPFGFVGDTTAATPHYLQLFPDWERVWKETSREVCQVVFGRAERAYRYDSMALRIRHLSAGRAGQSAGAVLSLDPDFILRQRGAEGRHHILGLQIHEMAHSYQPYKATEGAAGFSEAMPDAIRGLLGFLPAWTKGMKCTGSYEATYVQGGAYWYFIELRHPGFIRKIWNDNRGSISDRVQRLTGEPLDSLAGKCRSEGFPF